jgi:digeranylgeranylglycerophospholipid reductase
VSHPAGHDPYGAAADTTYDTAYDAAYDAPYDAAYDAIIVGAGPVGCLFAELLARASLRVALLEEHTQIGLPNHCSGLVSPRTLETAGIPESEVGLARYTSARVWGPGGGTLWLRSDTVQAVAVDRPRFDQFLADRAARAGAHLMLGAKATGFRRVSGGVRVDVAAQGGGTGFSLYAPLLVGADGANSRVARWMGAVSDHEVIPAIKADVAFHGRGTGTIEIFVGSGVAPGWFGWVIPLPGGTARIGIGASGALRRSFEAFLHLLRARCGDFDLLENSSRRAPLPLGPARDFVADHVLLVGAAARQTKPTTGGGLYFGLRAAHLAAVTATHALARGDCSRRALAPYERAWARSEGRELWVGHWLRLAFRRLSDRGLDRVIALFSRPWAQAWLSRLGDMDYPSRMLAGRTVACKMQAVQPKATKARQRAGLRA